MTGHEAIEAIQNAAFHCANGLDSNVVVEVLGLNKSVASLGVVDADIQNIEAAGGTDNPMEDEINITVSIPS